MRWRHGIVAVLFLLLASVSHSQWNKNLPSGSKAANLLDDDVRANNDALEDAFTEEHVFDTGGSQTGKHSFAVEDEATRLGDTDYVAGSVSIATDEIAGQYVFMFTHDGTTWHTPIDAFLNNANDWVKAQYVTPTTLTPAATITSTLTDGNIFTVTLDQNSTIANPTVTGLSGKGGVWFYIVTQDPATPRTLGFGANFYDFTGGQTTLAINQALSSVSVYQVVLDGNDKLQTTYLNPPFATDAEVTADPATVDYRAMTPANLAANFDDTAAAGYFEILGTGLILQWIRDTDCDNGKNLDFAMAFGDTNYAPFIQMHTSSTPFLNSVFIIDADTVQIASTTNNLSCSVMAIGRK